MNSNIFETTKGKVLDNLIGKIQCYKKNNNLHLYELLYSKDNQRIINDSNRIGEPYYSFSKKTSTETMSRILNGKGKITDEVARLIAENMGTSYSTLIWRVNEEGMTLLDLVFYNTFWVSVFYDALLSPKYKHKIIELFRDYIPFSKFIIKNGIKYIDEKSELEKLFGTEEFNEIIADATRRFLVLADISMKGENTSVWKLYMKHFLYKENTLKNLSKTIEEFFDFCYETCFQFVVHAYGDSYGIESYQLLDKCVKMTLTEYEMSHFGANLLEERVDDNDEEWVLKKELVIATYNFVDTLANYQKKIETITLQTEDKIKIL